MTDEMTESTGAAHGRGPLSMPESLALTLTFDIVLAPNAPRHEISSGTISRHVIMVPLRRATLEHARSRYAEPGGPRTIPHREEVISATCIEVEESGGTPHPPDPEPSDRFGPCRDL